MTVLEETAAPKTTAFKKFGTDGLSPITVMNLLSILESHSPIARLLGSGAGRQSKHLFSEDRVSVETRGRGERTGLQGTREHSPLSLSDQRSIIYRQSNFSSAITEAHGLEGKKSSGLRLYTLQIHRLEFRPSGEQMRLS